MAERYMPEPAPSEYQQGYIEDEFWKIQSMFHYLIQGAFEVLYAEPDKYWDGMLCIADGTNWDPGCGRGLYYYDSGASTPGWQFIKTGCESAPVAVDDEYNFAGDAGYNSVNSTFGLLANDTYTGTTTISVISGITTGSDLIVNNDGSFSCICINSNYVDTFTYQVTDDNGTSNTATVTLNVSAA